MSMGYACPGCGAFGSIKNGECGQCGRVVDVDKAEADIAREQTAELRRPREATEAERAQIEARRQEINDTPINDLLKEWMMRGGEDPSQLKPFDEPGTRPNHR